MQQSGFFSTATPSFSAFGNLSSQTPQEEKPIALPNGFEAFKVWAIRRATPYSPEEVQRAKLLNGDWQPKMKAGHGGAAPEYPQRCPAIWVDNFTFLYTPGMSEPELLLGRWKKDVVVYGSKQNLEGLVVAGGGHYERCGKRPDNYYAPKFEPGDMSLAEAARKELKEEIGIDPRNVRATVELGYVDDVFGDPRCHGLRFVSLRWVEQQPKPSAELSNILSVQVSQLHKLYNRELMWRSPEGKELGMILNHDEYLKLIMAHPATSAFLEAIKRAGQPKPQPAAFGHAWT